MKISQKFFFSSSKRQKKRKLERRNSLSPLCCRLQNVGDASRRVARDRERERERKREEETPEELRFCVPSSILSFVVVVLKYIETTTTKKKTPAALRERKKKANEFVRRAKRAKTGRIDHGRREREEEKVAERRKEAERDGEIVGGTERRKRTRGKGQNVEEEQRF